MGRGRGAVDGDFAAGRHRCPRLLDHRSILKTLIEQRVRYPLVRFGALRKAVTVRANLSIVALMGSYLSFQFMDVCLCQAAVAAVAVAAVAQAMSVERF